MTRLPVPGKDPEDWGDLLNSFLRVEHNEDGTLKVRNGSTFYSKPAAGIPVADLSSSLQTTLAAAADDSTVVHVTDNETIAGVKTFAGKVIVQDRLAVGGAPAANALSIAGDFNVQDTTASKQYRFRTSGSALDLDAAGGSLHLSVYDNGNFTGLQRTYVVFGSGADYVNAYRNWSWQDSNYAAKFSINPDASEVNLHGSKIAAVADPVSAQDAATKQYVDVTAPALTSGNGVPSAIPGKIGDMYIDTLAAKVYVATGAVSLSDWNMLN